MASRKDRKAADMTEPVENNDDSVKVEGQETLEGMPEPDTEMSEGEDGKVKRTPVPPGLRPLFNEIARLSGFLTIARRAVYDDDPSKAVKALALLERATPDAREIAELSV